MTRQRVFCFDIDGVIATIVPDNNYERCEPIKETIKIINELYGRGHRLVLHTARGSATGIDWSATTKKHLHSWGVKYHSLVFGKPAADYYIDDKAVPVEQLQLLISRLNKEDLERGC
jgi:CMP-N,N'-diacetyllegionaminic acid synthase